MKKVHTSNKTVTPDDQTSSMQRLNNKISQQIMERKKKNKKNMGTKINKEGIKFAK